METLEQINDRHRNEIREFIDSCPHTGVIVQDAIIGFRRRRITFICGRCKLNLLGYEIDGDMSCLSYVRDCVTRKKQPPEERSG